MWSFLCAHRNWKFPGLRWSHMCPLLTTTDLLSNEPQEFLFPNIHQQHLLSWAVSFLHMGQQYWSQIPGLASGHFLYGNLKITNVNYFSNSCQGLWKKHKTTKNLGESWENYDNPGFIYIDNNFNDLAQLPYDAHCHIMTPSEVIYILVKNDRRSVSN